MSCSFKKISLRDKACRNCALESTGATDNEIFVSKPFTNQKKKIKQTKYITISHKLLNRKFNHRQK